MFASYVHSLRYHCHLLRAAKCQNQSCIFYHLNKLCIKHLWCWPLPLQVVKVESGVSALSPTHTSELYFLRSRVRELEREKAELSSENQRLKTMLVHGESRPHLHSLAPFRCVAKGKLNSSLLTVSVFPRNPWAPVHHVADIGPGQQPPLHPNINQQEWQLCSLLASAALDQPGRWAPPPGQQSAAPRGPERGHFWVLGPAWLWGWGDARGPRARKPHGRGGATL